MRNNNVCVYEGQWWGGKPHGTGALKWANGNAYTGQLNEGNTQGQGIFTFADDASWEGTWDENKAVGPGAWCFPGGLQVDGAGPEPGCSRRTAAPAKWWEAARPQAERPQAAQPACLRFIVDFLLRNGEKLVPHYATKQWEVGAMPDQPGDGTGNAVPNFVRGVAGSLPPTLEVYVRMGAELPVRNY